MPLRGCRARGGVAPGVVLLLVVLFGPCYVAGAPSDKCQSDQDCRRPGNSNANSNRCCSRYRFCGTGPDYCKDGCILEDVEFVGGDLSRRQGGLGVEADRDDACAIICENNRFCRWFTYDIDRKLCYLKNTRGYLRRSILKGKVISGSTSKDGCEPDPDCEPPFQKSNLQCVSAPEVEKDAPKSTPPVKKRTSYKAAVEFCQVIEASLPMTFLTRKHLFPDDNSALLDDADLSLFKGLFQGDLAPDLYGLQRLQRKDLLIGDNEGNNTKSDFSRDNQDDDVISVPECLEEVKVNQDAFSCYDGLTLDPSAGQPMEVLSNNQTNVSSSLARLAEYRNWHWLGHSPRDDGMCVATIPGIVGKYKLFRCEGEDLLFVSCERRQSRYPFPAPPFITKPFIVFDDDAEDLRPEDPQPVPEVEEAVAVPATEEVDEPKVAGRVTVVVIDRRPVINVIGQRNPTPGTTFQLTDSPSRRASFVNPYLRLHDFLQLNQGRQPLLG